MMIYLTVVTLSTFIVCGYAQIITVSAGDQSLSSNEQLRVLTVIEGSNLIFTCSTTDSGGLVSATSSINLVESPGGTATSKEYTVENVQRTNISPTTTFSCADETNNLIFTLDILFPPSISNLMNGSVPDGGSVNITFTVDANPAVMESGVSVPAKEPIETLVVTDATTSDVTLVYEDLERSDRGQFNVRVDNSINPVAMQEFELDIYFGPDFTSNGGNIQVNEGESLEINCTVGDSNPAVQSVTVSGFMITGLMALPSGNRVYTVTDAVTTAYNGQSFTCTASNGETMTSITYTVTVIEAPEPSATVSMMTSSSTMSTSVSKTMEPSVSQRPETSNSSLSDGAIAGIAIGAVVGVAILVVVGIVIVFVILKISRGPSDVGPSANNVKQSVELKATKAKSPE